MDLYFLDHLCLGRINNHKSSKYEKGPAINLKINVYDMTLNWNL